MIVIHLARKPIKGTVVRNSLTHGTGGVNIEASRVTGRWPANLVLGHQPGCFHTGNKEVPAYVINRCFGDAGGASRFFKQVKG